MGYIISDGIVYSGRSGGGGGSTTFSGLTDVVIDSATLASGQVPVYNATTNKWENADVTPPSISVTQIQSTGTKIATITVDSSDTDIYAPEGGGHTVLNDSGTSLTQRPNLQFKGAYSEDNSADEITKVNVARTMTLAEFEELTEAEKTGFINVKDETGGSDDKFQPVIYSEEEREIGVWTDGKPLYEKTLNLNVTNSGDRFDISNLHIDTMIKVVGFIHQTGGNNPSVPYSSSPTDYALPYYSFSDDSIHVIYAGSYNQTSWVITVRYTKTTDAPGSGKWTPQGVPAHHYSTEEQVVGTWIDGSTLYEKTFFLSQRTPITNDYTTYIIDDITIYDIDNIISCEVFDSNSDSVPLTKLAYLERAVDVIKSNNKLIAFYNTNNTYKMTGFILRYTKSSS